MTNVKKFKLFCFEAIPKNDFDNFDEPITNIYTASDLMQKGYSIYAYGRVDGNTETTRTSKIKEITFSLGKIYIVTQNSDYLVIRN